MKSNPNIRAEDGLQILLDIPSRTNDLFGSAATDESSRFHLAVDETGSLIHRSNLTILTSESFSIGPMSG